MIEGPDSPGAGPRPRLRGAGALQAAAAPWVGTPWAPNSAVCGPRGGVACHLLPRAVYIDAGWLDAGFPSPAGTPNAGRHHGAGTIEPWVEARPEFRRAPEAGVGGCEPGDLLGFRLGPRPVVGHLGLMLGEGRFLHVLQHKGAAVDRIEDPTWTRRLLRVWRMKP